MYTPGKTMPEGGQSILWGKQQTVITFWGRAQLNYSMMNNAIWDTQGIGGHQAWPGYFLFDRVWCTDKYLPQSEREKHLYDNWFRAAPVLFVERGGGRGRKAKISFPVGWREGAMCIIVRAIVWEPGLHETKPSPFLLSYWLNKLYFCFFLWNF